MKARLYCGSYLPRWHTDVDYRTEYMSRRDLGGGALRTMCHEIDLVQYLLGPVTSLAGDVRRISDLEIDVDDCVMLVCRTGTGVTALVELDYLNPQPTRLGSFIGTRGRLDYSLQPPSARFVGYDQRVVDVFSDADYSLDEMYRAQMEDYLRFLRTGETDACSYQEGLAVMRVIATADQLPETPVEP
jgi:predicted dehydrogenase